MPTARRGTLKVPRVARNLLSPLSCRSGACPSRAQFEASVGVRQAPRKTVIPSVARTSAPPSGLREENLLFVRDAGHAIGYSTESGGSAGRVEGFGVVAGFGGVTGLFADVGLLCDGAFATVKYLRIFSRRFGPIPRIARKSSTLLNAPYDLRICKILSAVTGPIPGTNWSSSEVAVFKLTGAAGGFFFAGSPGTIAQSAAKRRATRARQCRDITVL
jgi:hypothetical protein